MSDQPQVLHVLSNAPPLFGGAARQAIHLSEQLLNAGIESYFISIDGIDVESTSPKIKRIKKI